MERSTRALSRGWRARAGSIRNPRACAYSTNASFSRGEVGSERSTIALQLSGITTRNTPPKNAQAASKPSITAGSAWEKVGHTNMWRENDAVNTRAWQTRLRPWSGS